MTSKLFLSAGATVALLASPALAQPLTAPEAPSADAVVTETLSVPDIADLAMPEDREGEYAEVNGARIFYEVSGEGPAMVLLHGYPLSGALFSRVRDALDDDFTVITMDHRGYGKSDVPDVPDTIETYANDALSVLEALEIDRAIIGGMSMGGPIVLSMYEQDPDRFSGLVLIDTTAAAATPAEAGLWRGVEQVIADKGMAPIYPALLPDMLSGETRLNEPQVGDYLTEVMKAATAEAGRGGAIALAERPDRTALLEEIDVPALVLVGQEDALYAMQTSYDMMKKLPRGELAIIPGASHAAIFEKAGESAAAISNWAGANFEVNEDR